MLKKTEVQKSGLEKDESKSHVRCGQNRVCCCLFNGLGEGGKSEFTERKKDDLVSPPPDFPSLCLSLAEASIVEQSLLF